MKNYKTILFTAALTIITVTFANAQNSNSSPYSRFGIGDIYSFTSGFNAGMGGLKYSIQSPLFLNPANPASYAGLQQQHFVFDVGLQGHITRMQTEAKTNDKSFINLGHLLYGSAIAKRWSIALGLLPYSSVGYAVTYYIIDPDIGGHEIAYLGDGGLNKTFIGTAFQINKNFSLGVNVNYLFGSLNHEQRINFDSTNYLNIRSENARVVNAFTFDFGLQYQGLINENKRRFLSAGIVANYSGNLNARDDRFTETFKYSASGTILTRDTIENITGDKGTITLPLHIGAGVNMYQSDQWLVGIDAGMQDWTKYKAFNETDSFSMSYHAALGAHYKVNKLFLRAGAKYKQTYLSFDGSQINDYGISFGVGIPIYNKNYSNSLINVGLELGNRGTTEKGLIKEQYIKFYLSFTMNQERWFLQPLYN
ncbi:MAG: hypothetical protein RQ866_00305 [Bacteroidales bacterium]|nr:hypothetical protein [Bacteroidales bacterium]